MKKTIEKVVWVLIVLAVVAGFCWPELTLGIIMMFGWKVIKFAMMWGLLNLACRIACRKSLIDLFFGEE